MVIVMVVAFMVVVLLDIKKESNKTTVELLKAKEELLKIKAESEYKKYLDMKKSNDIAVECFEEVCESYKQWKKYADELYGDCKDWKDVYEILEANYIDYQNLVYEFLRNIDENLEDEFNLYILNRVREDDGLAPITMKEFKETEEYYM